MSFLPGFGRSLPKPALATAEAKPAVPDTSTGSKTPGSTAPYTVRARRGFKSEVIGLLTELQAERLNKHGATKRVTEREMLELMLDAYKAVRRNGGASGYAVPLPEEVWLGVQEIARQTSCSPAEALESLIVEKLEALGLAGRKTKASIV